ncbi:MAG TPA: cation:proton antiporter [Pirellulales bacterium]|nr:cation:proton antiporter [Pirellulales bacterium]
MQTIRGGSILGRWAAPLAYALMVVAAVMAFLLVAQWGESLEAPAAATPAAGQPGAASGHAINPLVHVLLVLMVVVALGRLLSKLFARFRQPPVIGEVLAGIALGPSLLGRIWPAASDFLLPAEVAGYLSVLAQLGVILYMFVVGLELNAGLLRDRAHATIAISHASILAPFLLGAVLAIWLYPRLSNEQVGFTSFALFLGVAMSVTAFPVLARILTDRGMTKTSLGMVAISCAATDDVTAWCLLALVVGVTQAKVSGALWVIAGTLAFLAVMFLLVRPVVERLLRRHDEPLTPGQTALVFVAVLGSALTTEWIGVHAIFGAFLLGAVIPHDSRLAKELTYKLEDFVTVLLLPAFFAFTGMRTRIGLVSGLDAWLMCGVVLLVATFGKFGGTLGAARLAGLSWRDGAALGILMNTRGLMELVVLNIGLDLGVISPTLFAMMVVMAIVTTMATTPILTLLTEGGKTPVGRPC